MEKNLIDTAWVLLCAGLVFLMQAGFTCLESGLTRAKNSINVAIKNLADIGISVVVFWALGFGLMFGQSLGGWLGTSDFFASFEQGTIWPPFFLYQAMFCGSAITIVSGAVAERMRFASYIAIAVLMSGLVYPLLGHWAWSGKELGGAAGWLARLGFVDFAGSTVVHSTAGWMALAAVLRLGPRNGRFPTDGPPRQIPGHNLPVAILGTLLLWVGWFGFNGGSALGMDDRVATILINTLLAGVGGMVATLAAGWLLNKRAEVRHIINGSLAGLVAITAACNAVSAPISVLIGAVGGLAMLAVERLLENHRIDDVVGAIPVHAAAGVWGTIAVALFGRPEVLGTGLAPSAQLGIQLLGVAVCAAWSFGIGYIALGLIDRIFALRVSPEAEHLGLNIAEHGATSEFSDLLSAMDKQAETGDISRRVPVEAFTEVGPIAEHHNRVLDRLEGQQNMLVEDLAEASTYVQSLLPPILAGPVQTAWKFLPSKQLGGDAFDYHWLDEDNFALYLLDVCGHGVGAALLAVSISNILRSQNLPDTDFRDPAQVLKGLNDAFPMENHNNMFFTIWYGVFHKSQRRLLYANGGHPPAVLVSQAPRTGKTQVSQLSAPGLAIGCMPDLSFSCQECELGPSSQLFVFSDGVYEMDDSNGRALTYEAFVGIFSDLARSGRTRIEHIVSTMKDIGKVESFADDFSLLHITFS